MEADEDIDNETLQATVDASLAYVNDLVSSWMKPSNTPSSSRRDVEKEIEELMRRPPRFAAPVVLFCGFDFFYRLGVGAKPPESTDVSGRDALRLKGRLVDRKRGREEDTTTNIKTPSDDEDESRAGAIKKKPRLDPFDGAGKKKKKQKAPTPSEPGPSTAIVQELIEKARWVKTTVKFLVSCRSTSLGTKPDEVPSEPPSEFPQLKRRNTFNQS